MCIIINSPSGKIPKAHLKRALAANPDGWGYMFARDGDIYVNKGLTTREFWRAWGVDKGKTGPVVFHARIATHGAVDLANCHPFFVPNHDVAVVHNGVIQAEAVKDSDTSDTRRFVVNVLAGLPRGFLANKSIRRVLGQYIGWSKLALMEPSGAVTLVNAHYGHWLAGNWYSNNSYLPPKAEKAGELKLWTPDKSWRVPGLS